jgi:hypothetical protein
MLSTGAPICNLMRFAIASPDECCVDCSTALVAPGIAGLTAHVQSDAEVTLKAIWFRHPTNMQVNELMREGAIMLQSVHAAGLNGALERFKKATQADPMFAESHNKVATVLYLQSRCAAAALCVLVRIH